LIVVDASVLANAVVDDGLDGHVARLRLVRAGIATAPDLVDVETLSMLRRRWLAKLLTTRRFSTAVDDLALLPVVRQPTSRLMRRAYELRANVTAYDAMYVALAEQLHCRLVTADRRLANSPGIRCEVEVLGT
jgi:predicted nucleic acid-binding protein